MKLICTVDQHYVILKAIFVSSHLASYFCEEEQSVSCHQQPSSLSYEANLQVIFLPVIFLFILKMCGQWALSDVFFLLMTDEDAGEGWKWKTSRDRKWCDLYSPKCSQPTHHRTNIPLRIVQQSHHYECITVCDIISSSQCKSEMLNKRIFSWPGTQCWGCHWGA